MGFTLDERICQMPNHHDNVPYGCDNQMGMSVLTQLYHTDAETAVKLPQKLNVQYPSVHHRQKTVVTDMCYPTEISSLMDFGTQDCSLGKEIPESLRCNCNSNVFIRSSLLKLAEQAQWLLDKPRVKSINSGQRQWGKDEKQEWACGVKVVLDATGRVTKQVHRKWERKRGTHRGKEGEKGALTVESSGACAEEDMRSEKEEKVEKEEEGKADQIPLFPHRCLVLNTHLKQGQQALWHFVPQWLKQYKLVNIMDKAPIADYSGHPVLVLTLMDFTDFDTCSTGTQGCHIVKSARV
ncbi:hypothetical protein D9C73_005275 [Collichthys lucidus]|uniref:Uncharacterized protein n=1 Tax=Collichthys lucidus TaxID=240159 RepID=A0A4U5UA09_COLLU|nr:hypothetical protein D9C73_005275 [Collichthys lucidus]